MLYIAEYFDVGSTGRGSLPIPLEPPAAEQELAVGPRSVQSEPFRKDTCLVKLMSDEDCLIAIGDDPDATNSIRKLRAGDEKIIAVQAKQRIAVIASPNVRSVSGMDSLESLLVLMASPADGQKQFAALKEYTDTLTAAAADLKSSTAEDRAIRDQLVQATKDALASKADAAKAIEELSNREAALDRDAKDQADKAASDKAALDARSNELDAKAAELAASAADMSRKGNGLADLAGSLDERERELAAKQAALDAAQADFDGRMAKLKALAT